jgi:hypothetical protein
MTIRIIAALLMLATVARGQVARTGSGLAGWFPMEDGRVYDRITGGSGVSVGGGPLFTRGAVGNAAFSDGTRYVTNIGAVSDYAFVQNTLVFTISFWVMKTSNGVTGVIMDNCGTTSTKKGFTVYLENDAVPHCVSIWIAKGTAGTPVIYARTAANTMATLNQWRHVAIASSAAGNNVMFFIDGQLIATTFVNNYSGLSAGNSTHSLAILVGQGPVLPASCSLDDVRIYNRALSEQDIASLYRSRRPMP